MYRVMRREEYLFEVQQKFLFFWIHKEYIRGPEFIIKEKIKYLITKQ